MIDTSTAAGECIELDSRVFDCRPESQGQINLAFNENPFAGTIGKYPENRSEELVDRYLDVLRSLDAQSVSGVLADNVFMCRGANDGLDLVLRSLDPRPDTMAVCPPTFVEFDRHASHQRMTVVRVPLPAADRLDVDGICESGADCVLLCNPGNPTGVALSRKDITDLASVFEGPVIVDETYAEFCPDSSVARDIRTFGNLFVVRSLSKAFGLAALRVGAVIAAPPHIDALRRKSLPFLLPTPVVEAAIEALKGPRIADRLHRMIDARTEFATKLARLPVVTRVHAEAGFITVEVTDQSWATTQLSAANIAVTTGPGTIRFSIGTPRDNDRAVSALTIGVQ
ncbi:pyridoxal phosphate-dependent aminotransferase [Nocardia terpenica]|uniref:Aminotransferase n=1 Tax=Nocardia terpenica TaxID=455432 RepID=A0A164MGG7_9NOCA|nr:histidinol-phosphate transaminase [Nocardia terpenica]KZM73336.1 hypothetical protein AWN90_32275 [Nocardia terpenica]NQE87512.1 histidinol-phosphate aminotransferase family protein [Nocardia terpenica]